MSAMEPGRRPGSAMRSKRIEEDRTREIVDACERLYAATGFHAVSLRDIARETSMSRPSVYNYFRTKEEIFLALFAREYDRWNAALARLLARPGAADDAALVVDNVVAERAAAEDARGKIPTAAAGTQPPPSRICTVCCLVATVSNCSLLPRI